MNRASPDRNVYTSVERLSALRFQAHGFSFLPRQPLTSLLAGGHASRLRGRGLDFQEIRKYQPGDDPRQIDWKVTARTRSPHSRIYTEERERPAILLVDQRITMFFGSVHAMKSVTAAEAAALAAWRTIAVGDRVGAIVFNDRDLVEIKPQRTRPNVMRIFRAIVDQNRELRAESPVRSNPAMLNEALQRAGRIARHDSLVVLISDAAGSDSESSRLVTEISRHNDVLIAHVADPLEVQLPDSGRLVASDGQNQLEFDTRSQALRLGFRTSFEQRLEQARRFLLSREVPVLRLSTAEPVLPQVLRSLGGQMGRRHA